MAVRGHMGHGGSWRNIGAAQAWGEESPKDVVGTKRSRGPKYLGSMGDGFLDKELGKDASLFASRYTSSFGTHSS